MKQIQHIATLALASFLTLNLGGCSEKDEPIAEDTEKGIAIESITAVMEGLESDNGETATRATVSFSVNSNADPTRKKPEERGWKMDFTMYNSSNLNNPYADGSFTEATYDTSKNKWTWGNELKYFPNYIMPYAESLIYPDGWDESAFTIADDQSSSEKLVAQDVLMREKSKIKQIAHEITVEVKHKYSMLDFIIKDVVIDDIKDVTVLVEGTTYIPYKVATQSDENGKTGNIEYMLILKETTKESPIVQIEAIDSSNSAINTPIIYRQTIGIINNNNKKLGSNNCYCFTLQGTDLEISPITILNWATGESLPGEYIAVTAYPTFKAKESNVNQTFYFYYDSKLKVNGQAKLQKITFNENAECTIKTDGRILTHIYTPAQVEEIAGTNYMTPKDTNTGEQLTPPVILGQMIIDLTDILP